MKSYSNEMHVQDYSSMFGAYYELYSKIDEFEYELGNSSITTGLEIDIVCFWQNE